MQRRNVMRLRRKWILAVLIVTGLMLPACTRTSVEEPSGADAASVEPIEGSDVSRVILSSDAARRLDVQTAPVGELRVRHGEKPRLVMPYDALLYDPSGNTWVYTSTEPLAFVRAPVNVDRIDGNEAILSSGPPAGTEVVTVGASELLGVEYEVGEE
jgi:hypothetical protein